MKTESDKLLIELLDGDKEKLEVELRMEEKVYFQGGRFHPGYVAHPTLEQLLTIGGPIGGKSGGEYAMEVIHCERYEGGSLSGELNTDEEDLHLTAQQTPELYFRPLRFTYHE